MQQQHQQLQCQRPQQTATSSAAAAQRHAQGKQSQEQDSFEVMESVAVSMLRQQSRDLTQVAQMEARVAELQRCADTAQETLTRLGARQSQLEAVAQEEEARAAQRVERLRSLHTQLSSLGAELQLFAKVHHATSDTANTVKTFVDDATGPDSKILLLLEAAQRRLRGRQASEFKRIAVDAHERLARVLELLAETQRSATVPQAAAPLLSEWAKSSWKAHRELEPTVERLSQLAADAARHTNSVSGEASTQENEESDQLMTELEEQMEVLFFMPHLAHTETATDERRAKADALLTTYIDRAVHLQAMLDKAVTAAAAEGIEVSSTADSTTTAAPENTASATHSAEELTALVAQLMGDYTELLRSVKDTEELSATVGEAESAAHVAQHGREAAEAEVAQRRAELNSCVDRIAALEAEAECLRETWASVTASASAATTALEEARAQTAATNAAIEAEQAAITAQEEQMAAEATAHAEQSAEAVSELERLGAEAQCLADTNTKIETSIAADEARASHSRALMLLILSHLRDEANSALHATLAESVAAMCGVEVDTLSPDRCLQLLFEHLRGATEHDSSDNASLAFSIPCDEARCAEVANRVLADVDPAVVFAEELPADVLQTLPTEEVHAAVELFAQRERAFQHEQDAHNTTIRNSEHEISALQRELS